MKPLMAAPASITRTAARNIALSGAWNAHGLDAIDTQIKALPATPDKSLSVDGARIEALDTAGAWVLHKMLLRLGDEGHVIKVDGLRPKFAKLMAMVTEQSTTQAKTPAVPAAAPPSTLAAIGLGVVAAREQSVALLSFVGESAIALFACVARPARLRWRPILFNIRSAGFDALPIVGLLSFLHGVVVAYQGADQLRRYGANIFVADLVGLSMLREFAPLITAIIIAGRSGSAYAAQIGTMAVTEEIDAMRTLGIAPLDVLVLPKILALLVAMPLLTVFADVLGVFGGMIMAHAQLGVGYNEFLDRFVKAVSVTAFLIGICKAPVFAAIIAVVGCFQGFRTKGGADSVGRQTTRSVVQSIFLVIVADALFSVAFSALDL